MADTIALMRKRVLDMAIRGELVEQRREEETAEAIIEEIKIEKNVLQKAVTYRSYLIKINPLICRKIEMDKLW